MTFDEHGHLTPYEIVEIDLTTFEQTFVTGFENSTTRPIIFKRYLDYLKQLQKIVGDTNFYQWVDGSFVTQKVNPRDMDFVTFLDFEIFEANKNKIAELKTTSEIDCYFVLIFDLEHQKRFFYESDRLHWLHFFGHARNKKPKGIIQLYGQLR